MGAAAPGPGPSVTDAGEPFVEVGADQLPLSSAVRVLSDQPRDQVAEDNGAVALLVVPRAPNPGPLVEVVLPLLRPPPGPSHVQQDHPRRPADQPPAASPTVRQQPPCRGKRRGEERIRPPPCDDLDAALSHRLDSLVHGGVVLELERIHLQPCVVRHVRALQPPGGEAQCARRRSLGAAPQGSSCCCAHSE